MDSTCVPEISIDKMELASCFADITPAMLAVVDDERRMLYANTRFLDFVGASSFEEIRGERFGEVRYCEYSTVDPRGCGFSPHCTTCTFFQAVRDIRPGEILLREVTLTDHEGMAQIFRARLRVIEIDGHKVIAVMMHDISDEKRRENMERMFFHDFLNAAAGILGLLDIMEMDGTDSEEAKQMLHTARACAEYLVDEINFSRALSHAEHETLELKPEPVFVSEIMQKISGFFALTLAHTKVTLTTTEASQYLSVISDRTLVTRVIINLVKNAIEASKAGQAVTLKAEKDPSGGLHFEVHNESHMPFEIREKIFVRAFTTKGKGRGVGTYSVKMFTEQHLGGKVWFTSTPEEGTTFHVQIPALMM